MKKVGVLGGLGPQATNLFYSQFHLYASQKLSNVAVPHMQIESLDLWTFVSLYDKKEKLISYVKESVRLFNGRVDFFVSPCNTIHMLTEEIKSATTIPFMPMYEVVVKQIVGDGVKKVGILGTSQTVNADFYQRELQKYSVAYEVLNPSDESAFSAMIYGEILTYGDKERITKHIMVAISSLSAKGCDAVILACTELPLFVSQDDVSIKLYDSTSLLAKAALDYAISEN